MTTLWYRSFYWRIGFGFILFLAATLVAQALIGAWVVSRSAATLPGRSPGKFAALVASDVSQALATNPSLDLSRYVETEYAQVSYPMVIVMRDGRVAMTSRFPVQDPLVRFGRAQLQRMERRGPPPGRGWMWRRGEVGPPTPGGRRGEPGAALPGGRRGEFGPAPPPAPIVVNGETVGLVLIPARAPLVALMRQLGPTLALVAIALLVGGTATAAFVIFNPARRRLRAFEEATARLGAGDLSARAPVGGGDEITSLARSFNSMADELSARAERLEQEHRLRRQLLADVSHELGTPLTAIRGYIETLRMPEMPIDQPTRERYLGIVNDETTRLERIVADLLDLARLDAAGSPLQVEEIPVSGLFDRVVARHERIAADKHVRITTTIEPGAGQVRADGGRLEQALQNLAANALRHTPDGGLLELLAAPADGGVKLSVGDSGEGIAPEHLPHIFDRFYKADQSRASGPASGSGLGLSIVKAIAERHGGSVAVESCPGRTVFSIFLPPARR